jgi:hypothetical protein
MEDNATSEAEDQAKTDAVWNKVMKMPRNHAQNWFPHHKNVSDPGERRLTASLAW